MIRVENIADYAKDYKFIVARKVDNQYWFWGAWNERDKANEVALEIHAKVFRTDSCIDADTNKPVIPDPTAYTRSRYWQVSRELENTYYMSKNHKEMLDYERQFLERMAW